MLFACFIPGRGLMHHAMGTLMLPHHYAMTDPTWKEVKALDLVPPQMLADVSTDGDVALSGFVQGLGQGSAHIQPPISTDFFEPNDGPTGINMAGDEMTAQSVGCL